MDATLTIDDANKPDLPRGATKPKGEPGQRAAPLEDGQPAAAPGMADMLAASGPLLHAATADTPLAADAGADGGTAVLAAEAAVVAHIRETSGNVRITRGAHQFVGKPGDAILDGDIIDSGGADTLKLEFVHTVNRSDGAKAASGVIGANSRVLVQAEVTGQELAVKLQISAGAIALENLPSNGGGISVTTPAGLVSARGQGVGISVNPASSETTVVALGADGPAGSANAGVSIQREGAESRIGVSGEGLVLQAGNAVASSVAAPSSAQVDQISRLISGPSAGSGGGADSTAPVSAVATSNNVASTTSTNANFPSISSGLFSSTMPTLTGASAAPAESSSTVSTAPVSSGTPATSAVQGQNAQLLTPAVVTGDSKVSLTEANGVLSVGGTLAATDVNGAVAFIVQRNVAGSNGYGKFSIGTDGAWTYTADTAHNEFAAGTNHTDSITVMTDDLTQQVITVTIAGSNDAAAISGVAMAAVTEDLALTAGKLTASATLTVSDVDAGEGVFIVQAGTTGSNGYGNFALAANGTWTYTATNAQAAIQQLAAGATLSDTFLAISADGTASQLVSVTITGINDAAVITGTSGASLTETDAALTVSANLAASDVDSGADFVVRANVSGSNGYGLFSIDADGAWRYTAGAAHNEFVGGTLYTDSLTVATADGTEQIISVTVTGSNDAAAIGGTSTLNLTETDAALSAGASLTITDVDSAASFVLQTNVAGSNGYGKFSIDAAGAWSYLADSAHDEFVGGTTYTDSLTVASADGTAQVLSVTITGSVDTHVGGAGNDIYLISDPGDSVVEAANAGTDEVRTGLAAYTLSANVENLVFTGSAGAAGSGNALANAISGTSGNDTLDGGAGADTLTGGAGNDTYVVDDAADVVTESAGAGSDTVYTSLASYTLAANVENLFLTSTTGAAGSGNALANMLTGNAGNDTLDGGAGNDTMAGGAGDDIYLVANAGDVVTEALNEGSDEVRTSLLAYTLGANLERLQFSAAGNATGAGNELANTLTGNAGNDRLSGNAGDDTLDGGAGADTLTGGAGNDSINGGSGTDTLDYSDETGSVTVTMGAAGAGSSSGTSSGNDVFSNMENISGGAGADSISGNDDYNLLDGGAGNDTLSGGLGIDTLRGGSGDDVLDGGAGNDLLVGGDGNDSFIGGSGTDAADFSAETGAVSVNLASASGTDASGGSDSFSGVEDVTGGSGADLLRGDANANRLDGGAGNDTLSGAAGNDTLIGGSGTDTLDYSALAGAVSVNLTGATVNLVLSNTAKDGSGATDTLSGLENVLGGSGNDTLLGADADNNLLVGNAGNDLLSGGGGADTLQGGAGDDSLRGGAGNDSLDGGAGSADLADYSDQASALSASLATAGASGSSIGSDTLSNIENLGGGSGNDTLSGDAGANQIWGNGGADSINGGAGADTLRGGQGNDSVDGGADGDTICYDDITGPVVVNLGATTLNLTLTVGASNYAYTVLAGSAQSVTQAGANAGTDTLANIENIVGSGGADVLYGSAGGNLIDGAGGGDTIAAGAGDDTVYYDENDAAVDGGAGTDALVVQAGVGSLDLTLARDEVFTNFEILDVSVAGTQFVKLSDSDVKALTGGGASGTLIINGGSEDSVRLVGANWPTSAIPTESIGGVGYNVYTYNGATVKIMQAVAVGYLFSSNELGELSVASDGGDLYEGNGGNDTLYAGGGDDYGDGGSGDDLLRGDAGNDILLGGSGDDTLYGGDAGNSAGSGNDSLDGGTGNDMVSAGDGDDTASGGSGDDTIDGGSGNDSLAGGDGADRIDAGAGADSVDGGSGDDRIDAGLGNDSVSAGIGDDSVIGGAGDDTLDGGSGVDLIDYSAETAAVTVNLAAGSSAGAGIGNDILRNFENISGGAGDDSLSGNDAANRIVGGAGADSIASGAGNDWILFDAADQVDAGIGIDILAIATGAQVDFSAIDDARFVGIEEIDLTGNGAQDIVLGAADVVAFSDSSDTVKIHGDAGDHLTLSGNWVSAGVQPVSYNGAASQSYLKLTLALNGATSATVLVDPALTLDIVYLGAAGNDTLSGGGGADIVDGGAGNDSLDGAAGLDQVYGRAGNDTVIYDSADLELDGGADTDTLKFATSASGVVLDFGELARPVAGGLRPALSGFEIIDLTGAGNNTLIIDAASLKDLSDSSDALDVTGNAGDIVYLVGAWTDGGTAGGWHTYTRDGASARIASAISVGAVIDDPNGDADSANPIPGASAGADVIRGLGGNDTLDGGAGADVLRGGSGDDRLLYGANDLIVDGGDGSDTLALSASLNLAGVAGSQLSGIEIIDLVAGAYNLTLSATAANIAALNSSATVTLEGDANDAVALAGNWAQGAGSGGHTVYTLDGATLNLADALALTITYTGTALKDSLSAGAGRQTLDALGGNDSLDGGAGNDILQGGSGDDVLVYDAADASVAGGAGTDTLKLNGAGVTIDLTLIADSVISGIEKIDLTGSGANTLVLNPDDVAALSPDTDILIVSGDTGDAVRLAGAGWQARGSELVAGITYNKFIGYASDGRQVTVLGGLKIVKGDQIVGGSGADSLLGGSGGDDIAGMAGADSIDGAGGSDILDGGADDDLLLYDAADSLVGGGSGSDTLRLTGGGAIIDLQEGPAVAARPLLSGFEAIDLNTSGANYLILDEPTLAALSGGALSVAGDAADIVFVDASLASSLTLSGGVTLAAVTRGSAGDDSIGGSAGQDAIKSDTGNDSIDGGAGADIIYAGIGDDRVLYDAADLRVFGATGTDTLAIAAPDANGGIATTSAGTNSSAGDVDLTLVAGSVFKGFEALDLRGNGNQTVRLDEAAVLALSDTDQISVLGDLGDVLKLYGAWVASGIESDADGKIYTVMQKGAAFVHVVSEVTLDITNELGGKVVVGTSGADDKTVLTNGGMIAGDGDDIIRINSMSFTGVDGGRGYDKVYFQFTGDINTSLMAPTSLTNIEEIDLTTGNAGTNKLILTPDKLLEMTDADHILLVKGTAGTDSIDLYGDWSSISAAPDVLYNGVTYKSVTADNGGKLYYSTGMTVAMVDPTPQMTAFSIAYDDGAYLVSAGIDKYAGWKVCNAGDVNQDGIDDMIINQSGSAYVVFGTESMQGQIDLNNLGSRGFMISNTGATDLTSYSQWQSLNYGVSAIGDINGDGIADMISATSNFNGYTVIYGRANWSNIDLAAFTSSASNGFTITTAFTWGGSVLSGTAAVGDVNGDGYDDYAIDQMWSADIYGQGDSGKAYLLFGGAYSGNIATASMATTKGITLSSDAADYTKLGTDIAAIGDINADGFADFAIGGPNLDNAESRGPNGQYDSSGNGYVVFGKASGWANSIVVERDSTAPTLRANYNAGYLYPNDNSTNQSLIANPDLHVSFTEGVVMASGYVSLYNQTSGTLVERFDMATGLGSAGGRAALTSWGNVANTSLELFAYAPLARNNSYYVTIDASAIKDLAGNYFAGIADSTTWNFSTTNTALSDVTAPTLNASATLNYSGGSATIVTAGGSTGVVTAPSNTGTAPAAFRLDLGFSEHIRPYGTVTVAQGGTVLESFNLQSGVGSKGGSVYYFPAGNSIVDNSNNFGFNFGTTLAGSALTTITLSGLLDLAGNAMNGGADKSFTFTTAADSSGPVLTNTARTHTPSDNATVVSVENNIVFQSDETLLLAASGSVQLRLSASYSGTPVETFAWSSAPAASNGVYTLPGDHGGTLTVNNKTVTLNPGSNLAYNTGYDVFVSAGALTDLSGNAATGYAAQGGYNFTTANGLLTVAGGNAVDHSLKVAIGDNLEITFSESVGAGSTTPASQYIKLWSNTGALIETFDVADTDGSNGSNGGNVSFSGYKAIVDPGQNLSLTSGYYLTVSSQAIKSVNAATTTYYAGTSNATTLSFSTEAAVQLDPGQGNNEIGLQWAGQQIEGVGDVDGDGISDFVFGTYQQVYDTTISGNYAYGKYYLVFGQAGTWAPVQTVQQLKDAGRLVEIYGTAGNFLTRVVEFGDMNHDGFDDLLLTAGGRSPDNDTNNSDNYASNDGDIDAGAAFVLYGKARANWTPSVNITQLGTDGLEITGGLPQEQFGFSAASGDFNHDGTIDIVFGMPVNHRDGFASGEAFVMNGGDFTDSLMSVGTTGNNLILGDYNANRIAGQLGNDIIYGLGGADILRGGAGNDTIGISDLNFVLIDGGTGTDTLQFVGHGMRLDMTGYAGASLRSFEVINLTGDGNNSLVINYGEVAYLLERQLSQAYGTNVRLTIDGDAGDAVTLEGPWAVVATDATYTTYALDGLYVRVDTDVTRTVAGWTVPYMGATLDLYALPAGMRTSSVTSGVNFDTDQSSLGKYLVNIGDVNNDGFADFALRQDAQTASLLRWYQRGENTNNQSGAARTYTPYANQVSDTVYSGEAYVVYGKAGGLGTVNLAAPSGGNAIRLTGSASANENLGSYLSGLGDINGDGVSDMVIGASQSSKTFTFNEGGEKSGIDPTGAYDVTQGTGTYFSTTSLSTDWNSDSWTQSKEGRQYFFLGNNATLVGRTGGAITSTTLANDFNASGSLPGTYDTSGAPSTDLPDRGPENAVANTVFTYTSTATLASGSFIGTAGAQLGSTWQPVALGDVNGDGYDDFVTGNGTGTKLILGSAGGWTGFDNTSNAWTQKSVTINGNTNSAAIAAAGDVNGDGYADFVMSWDANGATLVFGKAGSSWNATTTWQTSNAGTASTAAWTYIGAESGAVVINPTYTRGLGDINGDGYDDLLFAANSGNDYSAKDNGGAYVLFGAASGWGSNLSLAGLAAAGKGFRLTGAVDFDYAGYDATGAGDVNGDGYSDFLLAAHGDDESANGTGAAGSAYLIFGRGSGWEDISLLEVQDFGIQIMGGARSSAYNWQQLGDVDGDGLDDLGYATTNATTILYGSENFTSGSNQGVQHVASLSGAALFAMRGDGLSGGADFLIGNAGDDTLSGDGGRDVLLGGAGNDLLKVADGNFFKLDGGTGVDTAEVTASATLNFTTLANRVVENIELLRLGGGDQSVTMNALDVLHMTGDSNTAVGNASYQKAHALVIDSEGGSDDVTLSGGWTVAAVASGVAVSGASGSFSVYQHGSDNLYAVIDDAITRHIS